MTSWTISQDPPRQSDPSYDCSTARISLCRRKEFQSPAAEVPCSSERSVSKSPQKGCLGWHVTRFRIPYAKMGPNRRRNLFGRASRPFRPHSRPSKPSLSQPSRSSAPIRLEPPNRWFTPSPERNSPNTSSQLPQQRDCLASKDTAFAWMNPRIPATRHSLRCRQIYEEMVQRIIYCQHAMILAPYIQTTPVLEPFTRYTIPPVRCFSTIVSPPPITWASSFAVCVAALLSIGCTAHPVA
jgi:hypothetical protein